MRHRVYGKHLGRDKNERLGLFRSLIASLILSENIQTTEAKAKAVKGLLDKLVNQAKKPTTQYLVNQFLTDKKVAEKLIKDIVPRLGDRSSGYSSIVRLGKRLGDSAMMVRLSWVESKVKSEKVKVKNSSEKKGAK